jgi:hypothetical protein
MSMKARDDRGSLIIALAVILVLSGLTLAVLARTVSALGSARLAQDGAAAVSAAKAGVADAIYVLDHTDTTVPGTLTKGSGAFTWTATYGMFTATVTSTGTVNRRSHTVQAQLDRRRRWPWVVATSGSLVLDGTDTISSNLAPVDPTKPAIASGGAMVLRNLGPSLPPAQEELLGPGASCSGCTTPVSPPVTTSFADPVVPGAAIPKSNGWCNHIDALAAGSYACDGQVTFEPGSVAVAGHVDLYVTNDGPPSTVTFSGAMVNPANASQFVLHIVGAGVIQPGDGSSKGSFTGIIDAPRASLRSTDCQFSLVGAAVLGSFDCLTGVSGPGPNLTYDATVAAIPATTWRQTTYQDVANP